MCGRLRTLGFTFSQSIAVTRIRIISIPAIAPVTLPLFQIIEADFDFDIQVTEAVSADRDAIFSFRHGRPKSGKYCTDVVRQCVPMTPDGTGCSTKTTTRQSIAADTGIKVKIQQADMRTPFVRSASSHHQQFSD